MTKTGTADVPERAANWQHRYDEAELIARYLEKMAEEERRGAARGVPIDADILLDSAARGIRTGEHRKEVLELTPPIPDRRHD